MFELRTNEQTVKMAIVCRVLQSIARKGLSLSRSQSCLAIPCENCGGSIRRHSNSSSIPSKLTCLVSRLIEEPNLRIKATLDAAAAEEEERSPKSFKFSWEALFTSLCSSSPRKAQLVLEWKLERMLNEKEGNPSCYAELIYMCGKIRNVPLAMQAFTSMEALGVKPNSGIFNALILACLSSANVTTALSLFEIMEGSDGYKPDSDTYNAFISAFANMGNDNAMLAWYSARKAVGFSADLQTYESLISGCAKSRNFDGVNRFYEELLLSGITPSVTIMERVLGVLCERRNLVEVKEFVNSVLDSGWEISEKMVEKLVRLYCDLRKVDEMEELLTNLTKSNQDLEILSRVHCGIIRIYATLDRLDDVEYSVGRMLKGGISFKREEDVNNVICSYFRQAAYDRLELFLECIRGSSYELARSSYALLVAGYRRAGLSEKLDMMMNMNDMKLPGFL